MVAKAAVAVAAGATICPNGVTVVFGSADWPVGVMSHTEIRPPGVAVAKRGTVGVAPPRCWPTTSSMLLHASAANHRPISTMAMARLRMATLRVARGRVKGFCMMASIAPDWRDTMGCGLLDAAQVGLTALLMNSCVSARNFASDFTSR